MTLRGRLLRLDGSQPAGASDSAAKSTFPTSATAWFASLSLHLLLLFGLAIVTIVSPSRNEDFDLAYELPPPLLEEEPLPQEFFAAEEPADEVGALSKAGQASARPAAVVLDQQSLVRFEPEVLTEFGEQELVEIDTPLFQGPEFSESLPSQGVGSIGIRGAEGAIDRLTRQIMLAVEQKPTLVVWLFDQSGSLRKERERIASRFHSIYDQLGVIEASDDPAFRQHEDKPLLTAVVGFGAEPQLITTEPTDRIEEILAAVEAIGEDNTGRENVFRAIAMSADKFRHYRLPRHGQRNMMIIVFTDEAGDDLDALDTTVHLCQKLGVSVYVIGRPAPFGRRDAYVKWIDPDPQFDQRPQWVPVHLGPESLLPERLKLQFIGDGKRDPLLDSGYGPFALTRLCYETGGIFFSSHPNRAEGRFVSAAETDHLSVHFTRFYSPEVMKHYQPEYVSTSEYFARLKENRACQALVEAADLSWTSPLEDVRLRFPKRDDASLANLLTQAQQAAALLQPKLDRICSILLAGEADRSKIRSPRWQAGYDLAVGRALAAKVRTEGYNAILAQAKRGMPFERENSNTWRLAADRNFANSALEKLAVKAESYLHDVVEAHPHTPWAELAARELETPLGWRWEETYTALSEPNMDALRRENQEGEIPPRPERRTPPPL